MTLHIFTNDLPESFRFSGSLAIDTETTGLSHQRDRLCLVQIVDEAGTTALVHFPPGSSYQAPHLSQALNTPVEKIFHFARFDMAVLFRTFGFWVAPVFCTKIASRLVRTYTNFHGLKDLCRDLLAVDLSKQEQTSDWGGESLTEAQLQYALRDVLHLHKLRDKLHAMLVRERRENIAAQLFQGLSVRAHLDLLGWEHADIYSHS